MHMHLDNLTIESEINNYKDGLVAYWQVILMISKLNNQQEYLTQSIPFFLEGELVRGIKFFSTG